MFTVMFSGGDTMNGGPGGGKQKQSRESYCRPLYITNAGIGKNKKLLLVRLCLAGTTWFSGVENMVKSIHFSRTVWRNLGHEGFLDNGQVYRHVLIKGNWPECIKPVHKLHRAVIIWCNNICCNSVWFLRLNLYELEESTEGCEGFVEVVLFLILLLHNRQGPVDVHNS